MSETLRTFIAVELPDNARNATSSFVTALAKQNREYKWVARRNLHITLAFLADVPIDEIATISDAIKRATEGIGPFKAKIEKLGTFASVVWLGITDSEEIFRKLYLNLKTELIMADIHLDERKFHPHITVARSRRRMTPEEKTWFESGNPPIGTEFEVGEIILVESTLTPKGPEYTTLSKVLLLD